MGALRSATAAIRASWAGGLKTGGTQIPRRCFLDPLLRHWKAILLHWSQLDVKLADRKPGQLFDVAQVTAFLVAAQRDRYAGGTGARRSADAVNIVFGNVRQFEVDDVRYAFHIDPSRGNVGSDEDPAAAVAKAGECALALGLRLVSMDGDRLDTGRS